MDQVLAFVNGHWFDGHDFQRRTMHAIDGLLSTQAPRVADRVIDLDGGYVVPPFAEAHNHNLHSLDAGQEIIRRYLDTGVFYVLVPNDMPSLSGALRPWLNGPTTVDAIFSHGGLTGPGGHPIALYETLAENDLLCGMTSAQLPDEAYYVVDSADDLERKWPLLMGVQPDIIKAYLLFSEETDAPLRGLKPSLLPSIVERAHAAGLRVVVHVETAADFHVAATAGVDMIGHLPGHSWRKNYDWSTYAIAEADARLAARRGIVVVTTASLAQRIKDPERLASAREVLRTNLKQLRACGVRLAIGSDVYDDTSPAEAAFVRGLGAFDDRTLLRMWCHDTPQAIFPGRRVGQLRDGYEATFLSLEGNPLKDWENVNRIGLRVKQGQILWQVRDEPKPDPDREPEPDPEPEPEPEAGHAIRARARHLDSSE